LHKFDNLKILPNFFNQFPLHSPSISTVYMS